MLQEEKRHLYNELNTVFSEADNICIPIENEHEYVELMNAFDKIDIKWNNLEKASTGESYFYKNTYTVKVKQIILRMFLQPLISNEEHVLFCITYDEIEPIHNEEDVIYVAEIVPLIYESILNVAYHKMDYARPQLPLI